MAYSLCEDGDKEDPSAVAKGCALIRANFGIDPETLTQERWAMLFQQAVWLENKRLEDMAKVLVKLLAPAKN